MPATDYTPILLVTAAPAETRAVLDGLGAPNTPAPAPWTTTQVSNAITVLTTGVGKANAAGALAITLGTGRYGAAVNLGVAGTLPGSGLGLLQRAVATACVFGDEGSVAPNGFLDIAAMGLPPLETHNSVALEVNAELLQSVEPLAHKAGPIATVSACSGTDTAADNIAERTGAIAESMEGAACALAAARTLTPFLEVRVISNTTGDRDAQRWQLQDALTELSTAANEIARALGAVPA